MKHKIKCMLQRCLDVSQPVTTPVPTLNDTEANNSSNKTATDGDIGKTTDGATDGTTDEANNGTIGGAVGGVISFLVIAVLCVVVIWYVKRAYKKKKSRFVNQRVHCRANELELDVIVHPDMCYDVAENRGTIDNDYDILSNSAADASKSKST